MDALRKGKTAVVEKDHVVMLGWTDKSLLFIKEIIKANESEGGGVVTVLSEVRTRACIVPCHCLSKLASCGRCVGQRSEQ